MIDIDFKMEGFADTEKALRSLPIKIRKRVLKKSLRAGAMVIKKSVQARAPVRSGTLKRSIKVRTGRTMRVQVFAAKGKELKDDGWYAHIIERGAKPHSLAKGASLKSSKRQKKGRYSPGQSGSHFMQRGADTAMMSALSAISIKFSAELKKELLK